VPTRHLIDSDHELQDAIRSIISLTREDLPEATGIAQVAQLSQDIEVVHAMIRRVYVLALDAEQSYVTELADIALRHIESRPSFSGGVAAE
jgi:hypothetical protein